MNDWKLLLTAASMCVAVACGDDDSSDNQGTLDGGSPDAAAPLDSTTPAPTGDGAVATPDGSTPVVNPPAISGKFAVVSQVSVNMDQTTSYVSVVDKFGAAAISLDGAVQINGRALAANEAGTGLVFVSTGGAPELSKYQLNANNKLDKLGSISFQAQGVASIGEYAAQLQFVSATKAYYFDTRTAQIIVWNPTALTVTSTIDIKSLIIADSTLTFTSTLAIKSGGKILLPAGWRSSNNQRVVSKAAVVILDTATDTASIVSDERCGYVRDSAQSADGRVYLATEAWGSSVYRINPDNAPKPCLLRLKADLSGFDTEFYKELNTLAGAPTGSLTQTKNGKVYTRVLDEAAANIGPMTSARGLASLPVWHWAEVTLGDAPTVTIVPGAPLSTGSLIILEGKDRRLLAEIKETTTELVDITSGIGSVVISTNGYAFSAVQL